MNRTLLYTSLLIATLILPATSALASPSGNILGNVLNTNNLDCASGNNFIIAYPADGSVAYFADQCNGYSPTDMWKDLLPIQLGMPYPTYGSKWIEWSADDSNQCQYVLNYSDCVTATSADIVQTSVANFADSFLNSSLISFDGLGGMASLSASTGSVFSSLLPVGFIVIGLALGIYFINYFIRKLRKPRK